MGNKTILLMITGHCGLNKHLHTIDGSGPNCEESEETVDYFLGQGQLQLSYEAKLSATTTRLRRTSSRGMPLPKSSSLLAALTNYVTHIIWASLAHDPVP